MELALGRTGLRRKSDSLPLSLVRPQPAFVGTGTLLTFIVMSLPPHLRFTSLRDASSGQIFFGFPIQRFKEWASTLNGANTVVKDIERLFYDCSILESNGETAAAIRTDLPELDSLLSRTSKALYKNLLVPDNYLSSKVLGAVVKRFEEDADIVEGFPAVVEHQSSDKDNECDAVWTALRGYMYPSYGLGDREEGDVGELWRLTLEHRLSRVLTKDGLNRKKSVATAKYALSRCIANLGAVTNSLVNTNGTDTRTAQRAWKDCPKSADASLHLLDRNLARYLLNKAEIGESVSDAFLREACNKHSRELFQEITDASTDQLTRSLIHFKTGVVKSRMKWSRHDNDFQPSLRPWCATSSGSTLPAAPNS